MPVIALILYGLFYPATACAYLDPGTGSLLLQGLISIFATLAVSAALGWAYIKRGLKRLFSGTSSGKASDTDKTNTNH